MITAQEELERFLDKRADIFTKALFQLARAGFKGGAPYSGATRELAELIQHTMILADLHGRKRILMEADAVRRQHGKFSLPDATPIVPGVPFEEALEDLLAREPRLAESAAEVTRLYSTSKVFAMAKSASLRLTQRVQQAIADLVTSGKATDKTEEEIERIAAEESHDWTRAYAGTVYRTNVATSYSNGRFAQANDPDVREVIPAMEFVAQLDVRTRPNHAAAHGLIAATDDPIWNRFKPPIGFQCRCSPIFVSRFDLERRGLIKNGNVQRYIPPTFAQAHPDPGFHVGGIDLLG